MKKHLICFGTRPEFIKLLPLIYELEKRKVKYKLLFTGQHKHMVYPLLNFFNIKIHFDYIIKSSTISHLLPELIENINKGYESYMPDAMIVHGDTATTLAGSLSSYYNKIPLYHIEAGLRTDNINLPWPEEGNRRLTSTLAALNFCPTESAYKNLINEGVCHNKIHLVGNTVIDAVHHVNNIIQDKNIQKDIKKRLNYVKEDKKNVIITGHRRENHGYGIENLTDALLTLSKIYEDINFIFPVHLNPCVFNVVTKSLGNIDNIFLVKPLDYPDFIYCLNNSCLVITDSGGIQEEAFALNLNVLITRKNTERPEVLLNKKIKLVGNKSEDIIHESISIINNNNIIDDNVLCKPFGSGDSCLKIVDIINEY